MQVSLNLMRCDMVDAILLSVGNLECSVSVNVHVTLCHFYRIF